MTCHKYEKIEEAKQFMEDFSFVEAETIGKTTLYRGYGTEPFVIAVESSDKAEFSGAAFAVESERKLSRASQNLPKECKATEVYKLNTPGGGKAVTFYDLVDGFPFHLVYGQTPVELRGPKFPPLKINYLSCQPFTGERRGADNKLAHGEELRCNPVPALSKTATSGGQTGPFWHVRDRLFQVLRLLHHILRLNFDDWDTIVV